MHHSGIAAAARPPSESLAGFFGRLFDTDFMPRSHCVYERSEIIWLHVASDAAIAMAYYSIPLALMYFVMRRRDLAFNWMFVLFAAFILACGTTHVFQIIAFWHPVYRLDGVVKAATGGVSVITAILLWPLIPKAVALPSPAQLHEKNDALAKEVAERRKAEAELSSAHAELEERVRERTAELRATNESLEREVGVRRRAEEHQALLVAELDHRVKNSMATVLSLASQSMASSGSYEEFSRSFDGRLRALVRAHNVLARARWSIIDLRSLLEAVLDPFGAGEGGQSRIKLEGPAVQLPPTSANALAMTVHELMANASKYGALNETARDTGRVHVSWAVEGTADGPGRVRLRWVESGGPPVQKPARRGLGTDLIEGLVEYELQGRAELRYEPKGVCCELVFEVVPSDGGAV